MARLAKRAGVLRSYRLELWHHNHPFVLAGESTQTYPGALSRSTAQPKNVEANVGAASRQRCAQLITHRPPFQTGKKKPRGTAWSNEKRQRSALVDPAANLGFPGVLSEPQRPRGHFGSAVLILLYFFSWPHTHPIRGATLNLFQKTWVLGSGNRSTKFDVLVRVHNFVVLRENVQKNEKSVHRQNIK